MKLTKNQQAIVASIKEDGRQWMNPSVTPTLYRQYMALVNKGALAATIDGNGIWFDLAN